jgi:hypothetical protein
MDAALTKTRLPEVDFVEQDEPLIQGLMRFGNLALDIHTRSSRGAEINLFPFRLQDDARQAEPRALRNRAKSTRALKRPLNPRNQSGVHLRDRAQSDLIVAHAVRRLFDQPLGGRKTLNIQTYFHLRFGRRADHCELLFATQTDICLLWRDLESAELVDLRHQLVVNGAQGGFWPRVQSRRDIVNAKAGGGGALPVGFENMMSQRVGVAVTQAQVAF